MANFVRSRPALAALVGMACLASGTFLPVVEVRAETGPPPAGVSVGDAVPVRIEREKPEKMKRPTLVFLRENLDFLRAQIDGVYWRPDTDASRASEIDPRWLEYLEMEQTISAGDDALSEEAALLASERLLESVGELVEVEDRLRRLDELLAEHEERLGRIHEDYVEDHVTTIVLLARGYPEWSLDGLRLRREDGRETVLTLDRDLEGVLRMGGVVELDHEFIEPREQWLELVIPSSTDQEGLSVYFRVEPERDRLHFVELDLESFDLSGSTEAWHAESWSRPTVLGSMDWTW